MTTTQSPLLNGIDTEALKQMADNIEQNPGKGLAKFRVTTGWIGGTRTETRVEGWALGGESLPKDFTIAIDEPPQLLGEDTAANPQEYLLAAMNACMSATYVAACSVQGIALENLEIETHGQLDLRGFLGLDRDVPAGYEEIEFTVRIKGDGTQQQFEAVHEWVKKTSPNYFNMANAIRLTPTLIVE